jgi:hypothetical protein
MAMSTPAKKVGDTPLVDLCIRAFIRCQQNNQQAAGLLDIKATEFSKAFSVNWPERNSVMKKWDALPFAIRLEFAKLIAADYELTAPDSEQTRVVRDFARLLKAVGE